MPIAGFAASSAAWPVWIEVIMLAQGHLPAGYVLAEPKPTAGRCIDGSRKGAALDNAKARRPAERQQGEQLSFVQHALRLARIYRRAMSEAGIQQRTLRLA